MNSTLKNTIQWTLYIFMVIFVVLLLLVPIILWTFFSDSKAASNLGQLIGIISVMLGVLSAAISCFSIYQANTGNKQVSEILDTVKEVKSSQKALCSRISEIQTSVDKTIKVTTTDDWSDRDTVNE